MTSLTEFFVKHEDETLKGVSHKNSIIKRNIIAHMAVNGECTLSELTKELHISVPTITKLVQELVEENIVTDLGSKGICISAGSACHKGKSSHVVSALGLDKRTAAGVIRLSFGPETTTEDIDAAYEALREHQAKRFPML